MADKIRIDKWLWAARFFKTRSLASDAIAHNRVRIAGQRIKPSRQVLIGDEISIEKPPYQYTVIVLGINNQRRPAVEAQQLYEETEHSRQSRADLRDRLRMDSLSKAGLAGEGRPSKKQRRQIIRFQNQNDPSSDTDADHSQ